MKNVIVNDIVQNNNVINEITKLYINKADIIIELTYDEDYISGYNKKK